MKKPAFLLVLFFLAVRSFAQLQPVAHLTIFSEDGDRFYLILNGEKMNDEPQTNLRVDDLTQPYYNARIIFEDEKLPAVSKKILQVADVDGNFMDVTYKIRKDKAGKPKLNYYSMIPVRQDFAPPSNVYVIHYGAPARQPARTASTTTTTTTTSAPAGVHMQIGTNGVGVSISDGVHGRSVSTTTTTTVTQSSATPHSDQYYNSGSNGVPDCFDQYAMSSRNFEAARSALQKQSFDDTRLSTARQIALSNCLNTLQIIQLCKLFGFEENKLQFAKFAYEHCTDPNNYFKVNTVFSFSTNADELNAYITNR